MEHGQATVGARRDDGGVLRRRDRTDAGPELAVEERVEARVLGRVWLSKLVEVDRVGLDKALNVLQHCLWVRLVIVHLALPDGLRTEKVIDRLVPQERAVLALVEQQVHAQADVDGDAFKDPLVGLATDGHIVAHVVLGKQLVQLRLYSVGEEFAPPVLVFRRRDDAGRHRRVTCIVVLYSVA